MFDLAATVLTTFAGGVLQGYAKDFFSGMLPDWQKITNKKPFENAAKLAVKQFLSAFQGEAEYASNFTFETETLVKSSREFISNDEVQRILARGLEPAVRLIEANTLEAIWREMNLPQLPKKLNWDTIGKDYIKATKRAVYQDKELCAVFDSQNIEALRAGMERLAGVGPGMDLAGYRECIRQAYGYLKLDAMHTSAWEYKMQLWRVFVEPRARLAVRVREVPKDYMKRLARDGKLEGTAEGEELEQLRETYREAEAQPVLEPVDDADNRLLVVLGDPGSGKSTLAQWLALRWAEGRTKTVPFLIELRKYVSDSNKPRGFLEYLEKGATTIWRVDQHEMDALLRERETLIIFDGLDEVTDKKAREEVFTGIREFAVRYASARVMVTSRIIGYEQQELENSDFHHATLEDFRENEIELFLDRWHLLAFTDANERLQMLGRIKDSLAASPAIRELAGNPLLLTIMAILNRSQDLPRDRWDLYDQSSWVLLHEWDLRRHLIEDRFVPPDVIGRKEKQAMLRRVAWEIQSAEGGLAANLIHRDDLERILEEFLGELRDVPQPRAAARRVVEQLHERNFILCYSGADTFSFIHRSFLEFFCAFEIQWQFEKQQTLSTDKMKSDIFEKHWPDQAWHEVLRLVCGAVRANAAGNMIEHLLELGEGPEEKTRAALLSAECLNEIRERTKLAELDKQVLARVMEGAEFEFPWFYEQWDEDERKAAAIRKNIIQIAAQVWVSDEATRTWLINLVEASEHFDVQQAAVQELANGWKDHPDTLPWLQARASSDENWAVRQAAVQELARGWKDHPDTLPILQARAKSDKDEDVRQAAVQELANGWKDHPDTLPWLQARAKSDKYEDVRQAAVQELARGWKGHPSIMKWLQQLHSKGAAGGSQ